MIESDFVGELRTVNGPFDAKSLLLTPNSETVYGLQTSQTTIDQKAPTRRTARRSAVLP